MPEYEVTQRVIVVASGSVTAAEAARRLWFAVPVLVPTLFEVAELLPDGRGLSVEVDLAPTDTRKLARLLGRLAPPCGHTATSPVTLCGDCGAILGADGAEVDPLSMPVVPPQGNAGHRAEHPPSRRRRTSGGT